MLRRFISFVLLVFLTASCAMSNKAPQAPQVPKSKITKALILHMDNGFTPSERAIVLDSFAEWQRDTRGIVSFKVDPTPWIRNEDDDLEPSTHHDENGCTTEAYIARSTSDDPIIVNIESESGRSGGILGLTHRGCAMKFVLIVVDRMNGNAMLRQVTVHEIGHLVGLSHIPIPNESVMFPSVDMATQHPTRLDMAQFCLLYGCDYRDLIY